MKVILASGNKHKAEELQQLLNDSGLDIELVTMAEAGLDLEIDETGQTFEENAFIKAHAVWERLGLPTLADDSGLEVDSLHGAPGVYSARYAGINATDKDNRDHLVANLLKQKVDRSTGQFRCVLCYMDNYRTLFGEGTVRGNVVTQEKGEGGFGYDPLFIPEGYTRTFAEMKSEEKHALSHRGNATRDIAAHLLPLLSDSGRSVHADQLPIDDALIMACVAAVTGNDDRLRSAIRLFVQDTHDAIAVYEALLQTYLFAGFPVALEALTVCHQTVTEILPDHEWPRAEAFDLDSFRQRGTELCKDIYVGVYDRMMERLGEITPDLSEWMIVEGYGKTLSRDGLDVVHRELCICSVLACLGRENQLTSHVRGALNVGASLEQLKHTADAVTEWSGRQAGDLMRETIARFS